MVRYLSAFSRSTVFPILLISGFSFLLVSYSLLGNNHATPARLQAMGWQAWEIVQYPLSSQMDAAQKPAGTVNGTLGGVGGGEDDYEDDWGLGQSLPLDTWNALLPHSTGLTDITVKGCYLPPWLYPSMCSPETTPEADRNKGKWVRVDRDLNWKTGIWYLNLYYRRTRRFDVPLINDILLLQDGASPPTYVNLSEFTMAEGDLHSGFWSSNKKALRMWYKTTTEGIPGAALSGIHYKREQGRSKRDEEWSEWDDEDSGTEPLTGVVTGGSNIGDKVHTGESSSKTGTESKQIITELDVLFGDDQPWFGFERVLNGPVVKADPKKYETVDIVVRRGNPVAPNAIPPKFSADGQLKIMQIADLHYSVGTGECLDTDKRPCVGDADTAELLGKSLDLERPDMVVFSGDQLNGQGTSYDSKSVLAKFAAPVIDRRIPWAVIFGNHDSEIMDDRAYQMKLLQTLPYSLAQAGPAEVDGVGNYMLKILSGDSSRTHCFTLFFMDSHARQPKKYPWEEPDYDYIKPSQIQWFLNTSNSVQPIERPFVPPDYEDNSTRPRHSKNRLTSRQMDGKVTARPNAMMFFHIPIPESYGPVDHDHFTGAPIESGTSPQNDIGSSKHNGGMFMDGLKKAMEIPEGSSELEWAVQRTVVKIIGHGHSHNDDMCRRSSGIWSCFGGGGSYSGYGLLGFQRRYRMYHIANWGETIYTWKRLADGTMIDEEVLVGEGAPMHLGEDQPVPEDGMGEGGMEMGSETGAT